MAIQTVRLLNTYFYPDSADPSVFYNATVDYRYDDVALVLVDITCVQDGPTTVILDATSTSTGATFTRTAVGPGTVTETVPLAAQASFGVFIDGRGRVDGIEYRFSPYITSQVP